MMDTDILHFLPKVHGLVSCSLSETGVSGLPHSEKMA